MARKRPTLTEILADPKTFWAVLSLSGLAYEARALRIKNGGTASEATRFSFRVDTPAGRWAFLIFWGTLNSWYSAHIIGPVLKEIYEDGERLLTESSNQLTRTE